MKRTRADTANQKSNTRHFLLRAMCDYSYFKKKYVEEFESFFVELDLKIDIERLFEGTHRVSIEGVKGIGKTSLLKHWAKEWAWGRVWKDRFDLVVFVDDRNSDVMDQMLQESNLDWERVLWMFDGSIEKQKLEQQKIKYLISTTLFERQDRVVRVEGLNDERQREYLRRYFGVWNEQERSKGAMAVAVCLRRIRIPKEVIWVVYREVKRLKVTAKEEGIGKEEEARKIIEQKNALLKQVWRIPLVLQKVCEEISHGRKRVTPMIGKALNEIVGKQERKKLWETKQEEENFLDDAFKAYVKAESLSQGMDKDKAVEIILRAIEEKDEKEMEQRDLMMSFAVGLGGNVINSIYEWVLKSNVSKQSLGPFEWLEEDETGMMAKYMKKYWKDAKSNLSRYLIRASEKGYENSVTLLIEMGANVSEVLTNTSMMVAAANGHLNILRILAKNGAKKEQQNSDKWTAFHFACRNGFLECAKFLAKDCEEVMGFPDKNGSTPLIYAVIHGII